MLAAKIMELEEGSDLISGGEDVLPDESQRLRDVAVYRGNPTQIQLKFTRNKRDPVTGEWSLVEERVPFQG